MTPATPSSFAGLEPNAGAAPHGAGLRILVADDIEASRDDLCQLVRSLGHQVLSANGGEAALAVVRQESPDVVLLDLLMPDVDGFEVTRRIRDHCGDRWLPVIVTSSWEGDEHFAHALREGADDYLSRPVNVELLDAKLEHYRWVLAMQANLGALAQRQRAIQDNILDAVLTLDSKGRVVEFNRAARHLFALQPERSLMGLGCQAVLGTSLDELLSGQELSLRRGVDDVFPAEVGLSEWRDEGQQRYTVVVRDLTERRQIERMKDEFLATVSHELRTPLTSVLGALGLLAAGAAGPLPAAAKPLADVARRNGERLSRLIDDILDLTKLEGNRMVLSLRPLVLGPLVREALAANQGYASRTGVNLKLLAEAPANSREPEVRVDADRFLQVMANLLSNAIKHTPGGGTVTVTLSVGDQAVALSVRDQGPGIDPAFRARMFEKFSQADSSDRRAQGGTGLGLYITRLLVERMGGRISADSVAGQGACFGVEFPRVAPEAPPIGRWMLHIDQDLDARHAVAECLASLGPVESAADIHQAQQLAQAHEQPPLVIADPRAQGRAEDFCTALRALAQNRLPVLLYTDSVDEAFVRRMGLEWIRKSRSDNAVLAEAVSRALGQTPRKELA